MAFLEIITLGCGKSVLKLHEFYMRPIWEAPASFTIIISRALVRWESLCQAFLWGVAVFHSGMCFLGQIEAWVLCIVHIPEPDTRRLGQDLSIEIFLFWECRFSVHSHCVVIVNCHHFVSFGLLFIINYLSLQLFNFILAIFSHQCTVTLFVFLTHRFTFRRQRAVITCPAHSVTPIFVTDVGKSTGTCAFLETTPPTWVCLVASTATCLRNPTCDGWSVDLFVVSVQH